MEIISKQRKNNQINKNCMMIAVLNSLKLNNFNTNICKTFEEIENNGIPGSISKLGRKFRDTILSKGGSEHPADIFKQFRGRAPTPDALLRHSGIEL